MDGDRALTTARLQHSTSSADDRQVAGLIARLLLHYWAGDMSDGARKAMAEDWLDDLREFGPEIVVEACSRWRRSQTRRPTIADIRALCIEEQAERRPQRGALPPLTNEEAYARSAGWSSAAERRDAIAANELRYRKADVWRAEQAAAERAKGFVTAGAAAQQVLDTLGVTATEAAT